MTSRQLRAITWPAVPPLPDGDHAGVTEPWVVDLCTALLVAIDAQTVLELGTSIGQASGRFCQALQSLGGGWFYGLEPDQRRRDRAIGHLSTLRLPDVRWTIIDARSPDYLATMPDQSIDFAWVDDQHDLAHVRRELTALRRIVHPGGLICGHDVVGPWKLGALWTELGGLVLNLPQSGAGSGGIGIYQVPA